jgi:tRNA1(Val) A37 N6-methylase TrmN6
VQGSERLRFGRFYTESSVAGLALELAAPKSRDRVWDPTCGDGVFLRAAQGRGHTTSLLHGHDIDREAVAACLHALPGAELAVADLFTLCPETTGLFEVIVGNPPYVRNERLPASRREEIRARLQDVLGFNPPAQCDLSVLSLLQALRFLAPGGRLAFVMPNTWMDAGFGKSLRPYLLQHYRLRAVVESRSEPWFPEASINTVIVVLEAPHRGSETKATCFAQLLAATEPRWASAILDNREPDDRSLRRRWVAQEQLLNGKDADTQPRWSTFLRAAPVYFDVLEQAADRAVRIGDTRHPLLRKGYGTKVGISAFFSPRRSRQFEKFAVEERHQRPFLRTLRGLHRYVVREADVEDRLFVCDSDPLASEASPGARSYILWGEQQTRNGKPWPQVPSVQGNHPWYKLPELRTGDVILPQFRMDRHYVMDNPEGLPVNNSAWWAKWINPDHREVGVALLNSTWVALSTETVGRLNLGEGLLTCYGPDLDDIHVPDPDRFVGTPAGSRLLKAWRQLSSRNVLPLREEIEKGDRRALDEAVLDGLGLNRRMLRPVQTAAVEMLEQRIKLAAELRRSRQAQRALLQRHDTPREGPETASDCS